MGKTQDGQLNWGDLFSTVKSLNPGLTGRQMEHVVKATFDAISTALADGRRVELKGFGVFSVKHRTARTARDISRNEPAIVPDRNVAHFKAGTALRRRVNGEA